jgi:hypothetical protein
MVDIMVDIRDIDAEVGYWLNEGWSLLQKG